MLRNLPTPERLRELRSLRLGLEGERHGRAQAAILAAQAKPEELRWMANRPLHLIRAALKYGEEKKYTVEQLRERVSEFVWRRMMEGRIQLRTAAKYTQSLKLELAALCNREKAEQTNPLLMKKLATLVKADKTLTASTKLALQITQKVAGGPKALVSFLWLSGCRGTEAYQLQTEDVEPHEDGVRFYLKGKGSTDAHLHPLGMEWRGLEEEREEALKLVVRHRERMRKKKQRWMFGEEDFREVKRHLPEGVHINAWRHGLAQGTEEEIKRKLWEERMEERVRDGVQTALRHKSRRSQDTYRQRRCS